MRWFSWFFFVSGLCGLVYEVVWLRLAMASFGVTTPFVSIVLSVFMAGLAIGSALGGRIMRARANASARDDLRLYAAIELAIGAWGVVVPSLLTLGRGAIESIQGDASWSGGAYCLASGAWIALALLPGCACMGATFPFAMSAIRKHAGEERSFSRLYLANVLGAAAGTLVSAFVLIELLGFRGTLWVTASMNALLALAAFARSGALERIATRDRSQPRERVAIGDRPSETYRNAQRERASIRGPGATLERDAQLERQVPAERGAAIEHAGASSSAQPRSTSALSDHGALGLLFTTGLLSMAMEVVWVRQFTPYLGTVVYAFASILAWYLLATFAGSAIYRRWSKRHAREIVGPAAWLVAGALALVTLAAADPFVTTPPGLQWTQLRTLAGIGPIAGAFGFLTPLLVDRYSAGDPERAGTAYAINVIGCIAGPLVGCFVLMPGLGERGAIVAASLPLFAIGLARATRWRSLATNSRVLGATSIVGAAVIVSATHDFEARFKRCEVRRDATCTAIATALRGEKQLFINGISISRMTPITKMMVHLPMAWRATKPKNVLVICFGMGTSFRSGLTWGVPCTTVELCSVVPELFSFFHEDAAEFRARPGAEIVIDDGRRYLERVSRTFDVITLDPPPPVEAAASSLLYSREFYQVVKKRLSPNGVLQAWCPEADAETHVAIERALVAEFPHVRAFASVHGAGVHYLASEAPLGDVTADELAARMPEEAAKDLVEWGPERTSSLQFAGLLARERKLDLAALTATGRAITDDRAVNEYFFLRRTFGP
jgi:predicted membrane-bound spermidine synthase